ncbi:MAG: hypothetical protein M0T70_02575 [Geobacteraceae bacterium]|nr:hypothetical protein [Geobacteraceae bacterium]
MELTKENFDDFISRLKYHNQGEGVDDHCTAEPLFIVQSRKRHVGIDLQYDPPTLWVDCPEHETEYETYEELRQAAAEYEAENECTLDEWDFRFDDEILHGKETVFQKVGYFDTWEFVTAHFTKEAAEAFIARKKHDHRELRIYVEAQVYCWEWNAIVKGFLTGKITFNG